MGFVCMTGTARTCILRPFGEPGAAGGGGVEVAVLVVAVQQLELRREGGKAPRVAASRNAPNECLADI